MVSSPFLKNSSKRAVAHKGATSLCLCSERIAGGLQRPQQPEEQQTIAPYIHVVFSCGFFLVSAPLIVSRHSVHQPACLHGPPRQPGNGSYCHVSNFIPTAWPLDKLLSLHAFPSIQPKVFLFNDTDQAPLCFFLMKDACSLEPFPSNLHHRSLFQPHTNLTHGWTAAFCAYIHVNPKYGSSSPLLFNF